MSELTYPMVHQTVVTDGQSYYTTLHQLNTLALHGDNATSNPCTNFLWLTQPQRLWEKVEEGTVKGLNLQLLSHLTAMYMKNTVPNTNPTPYLAQYKYLWHHPAIPWYRSLFHHKMTIFKSDRFWVPYKPELMAWEKLYKLDFNTMPITNNGKRFFEGHRFRLLPQDRTCRHIKPPSIKVADRPLGKKDPLKREPMIDSEKLFDKRVKNWENWRYHRAYTYVIKP
ncbi:Ribosomal protein L37/S30 [Trinorchestia longiramus]|nr:Ribosomal protein L37/S30 [Trinorchestia longiramus]